MLNFYSKLTWVVSVSFVSPALSCTIDYVGNEMIIQTNVFWFEIVVEREREIGGTLWLRDNKGIVGPEGMSVTFGGFCM